MVWPLTAFKIATIGDYRQHQCRRQSDLLHRGKQLWTVGPELVQRGSGRGLRLACLHLGVVEAPAFLPLRHVGARLDAIEGAQAGLSTGLVGRAYWHCAGGSPGPPPAASSPPNF